MRKNLNYLLSALTIFVTISASAQSGLDTSTIKPLCGSDSLIDLGRIKIRKDLAQTITIKARDLEHMPFDNLADALAPWLQGALTSPATLVYVIDGNIMNDVNAYSIHDIDEITVVQNALARVNGAQRLQQLVLVKTKRYSASSRISVSGQSFLVKNKFDGYPGDIKSESNFYHQYTVTAWKAIGETRMGLNASFLRDVMPAQKSDIMKTNAPHHVNRYRFFGWFDASLGEGHSVAVRLNFVPQSTGYDYRSNFENSGYNYQLRQTLFNPSIKLSNRLLNGLTNEINISYLSARVPTDSRFYSNSQQGDLFESKGEGLNKFNNFLIRENLAWQKDFGKWQVMPALNFTFRSVKDFTRGSFADYTNGQPSNLSTFAITRKLEAYVLSPSASIAYSNSFYMIGGISTDLGDETGPAGEGIFPFASLTFDVLRIKNADNPSSLKLFGSFSKGADFGDLNFNQADLITQPQSIPGYSLTGVFGPVLFTSPYPENPQLNGIQAGLMYSSPNNRVQINYNYDNREYLEQVLRPVVVPPNGMAWAYTWINYAYAGHRLGLTTRIIDRPDFSWSLGFNATTFSIKYKDPQVTPLPNNEIFNNNDKTLWTGGFTNRLFYKKFIFGLDLLYLLNEERYSNSAVPKNFNNWRINNVYAGYHLQVKGRQLEVYISSRNCLQNKNSFFIDDRQFYGAGFKIAL